jgi:hypothetical protein
MTRRGSYLLFSLSQQHDSDHDLALLLDLVIIYHQMTS